MQLLTLVSVAVLLAATVSASPLYGGFGGSPSTGFSPRTGSSWPPYPGAGQGYWAQRAGFYSRRRRSAEPRASPSASALYLGLGGVVGQLTPRTGPSFGNRRAGVSASRRSSSGLAAARRAGALYRARYNVRGIRG